MEFVKIVFVCVLAVIVYGIVHDQITARVCLEYFTVFHPDIFHTTSPTLLAFGWGVVATWWAGAIVGLWVAMAARWGSWPQLGLQQLCQMIAVLLLVMGLCALVAGVAGYNVGTMPADFADEISPTRYQRFLVDWWSHTASYVVGFAGGLVLCGVILIRRHALR